MIITINLFDLIDATIALLLGSVLGILLLKYVVEDFCKRKEKNKNDKKRWKNSTTKKV